MGRRSFSQSAYTQSSQDFLSRNQGRPVTSGAERVARDSGRLNPLVDPSGFQVIRRSLPRLEKQADGTWLLTIGTPMPLENLLDTTASMGDNVEIMFRVLPQLYGMCSRALPGYDLHQLAAIFGDIYSDQFPLCRPQYEAVDDKILEQLTLLVPEKGGGGNGGEDPQYGLFGAAYLVAAYANRIGLGRYHFTVSDEPGRDSLDDTWMRRLYGNEVYEYARTNGFDFDRFNLPSTKEIVADLLKQAHAFFLHVEGHDTRTFRWWTNVYGADRTIRLPNMQLLPALEAVVIGLTEGTFGLDQVRDFLIENRMSDREIQTITRAVSHIPIGAQTRRPGYGRQPQAGALFVDKPDVFKGTNLWPINIEASPSGGVRVDLPELEMRELEWEPEPPFPGAQRPDGPNWL